MPVLVISVVSHYISGAQKGKGRTTHKALSRVDPSPAAGRTASCLGGETAAAAIALKVLFTVECWSSGIDMCPQHRMRRTYSSGVRAFVYTFVEHFSDIEMCP